MRPKSRWFIVICAATVGTAILLFHRHEDRPDRRLIEAASRLPYRTIEGRLSGFAFAPAFRPRGNEDGVSSASHRMRAIASEITAGASTGDASQRDAAIARAVVGDIGPARLALAQVVAERPNDAASWSDYAAILYEDGIRNADPSRLAKSLAAADRSLNIEPRNVEAAFNRAIALEALHLDPFARHAFAYYLSIDGGSAWAQEGISRLRALRRPTLHGNFKEALAAIQNLDVPSIEMVRTLVKASPRDARRHAEGPLIVLWGEATIAGTDVAARRSLNLAAGIGATLEKRSGERLISDTVRAIEHLSPGDRVRFAKALVTYKKARIAYASWDVAEALAGFRESLSAFESANSPLAIIARYYVACTLADLNQLDAAFRELETVSRALPRNYVALRAQIRWTEATTYARMRRLGESAQAYEEATKLFEALGELQEVARLRQMLAHILTLLGRSAEAWEMRMSAFRIAAENGDDAVFAYVVSETAQQAMLDQQWDVAHSFHGLILAGGGKTTLHEVEARTEQAIASWRGGFKARADRELAEAEKVLPSIRDEAVRQDAAQSIAFARAQIIGDREPTEAIALLRHAIDYNRQRRNAYATPWMLAEEARLLRRQGSLENAIRSLEDALAAIDASAEAMTNPQVRDSYLGTTDTLSRDLVDAYLAAGRAGDAFNLTERQRSRLLSQRIGAFPRPGTMRSLDEIAEVLPSGALMLHYTIVGKEVWLLTVAPHSHSLQVLVTHTPELVAAIKDLQNAIHANDESKMTRLSQELFIALLGPVAEQVRRSSRLIIVTDGALADVPFAALRDRTYLIEQAEIVLAPSANVYAAPMEQRSLSGDTTQIVVITDPAFDTTRYPALSRLSAAQDEGREIATLYADRRELTGREATVGRVVDSITDAGVVHIGAHVVINERDPGMSALLLTADSSSGDLYLHQIAAMDLHHLALVVLAGCRSATPASSDSRISSLTSAFLAAGAHNVVGSIWDVDDSATRAFSVRLHQKIARGIAPGTAMRLTQIEMIRSSDPRLRRPSSWAGMQLYGTSP